MKKILMSALMLGSVGLWADNILGLKLTNDTLAPYAQIKIAPNNIFVRGEYLYNDNENKHNFCSLGVKAEGNLLNDDNKLKFAISMNFVHTKNNSALPIGLAISKYIYDFQIPVYAKIDGEYAPKVLSFDDADRFSKVDISIGIKPIENAKIFTGYRNISFNHNYNSSIYGGVAFIF